MPDSSVKSHNFSDEAHNEFMQSMQKATESSEEFRTARDSWSRLLEGTTGATTKKQKQSKGATSARRLWSRFKSRASGRKLKPTNPGNALEEQAKQLLTLSEKISDEEKRKLLSIVTHGLASLSRENLVSLTASMRNEYARSSHPIITLVSSYHEIADIHLALTQLKTAAEIATTLPELDERLNRIDAEQPLRERKDALIVSLDEKAKALCNMMIAPEPVDKADIRQWIDFCSKISQRIKFSTQNHMKTNEQRWCAQLIGDHGIYSQQLDGSLTLKVHKKDLSQFSQFMAGFVQLPLPEDGESGYSTDKSDLQTTSVSPTEPSEDYSFAALVKAMETFSNQATGGDQLNRVLDQTCAKEDEKAEKEGEERARAEKRARAEMQAERDLAKIRDRFQSKAVTSMPTQSTERTKFKQTLDAISEEQDAKAELKAFVESVVNSAVESAEVQTKAKEAQFAPIPAASARTTSAAQTEGHSAKVLANTSTASAIHAHFKQTMGSNITEEPAPGTSQPAGSVTTDSQSELAEFNLQSLYDDDIKEQERDQDPKKALALVLLEISTAIASSTPCDDLYSKMMNLQANKKELYSRAAGYKNDQLSLNFGQALQSAASASEQINKFQTSFLYRLFVWLSDVLDKICHPLTSQPGDYRFFAEMVKQKNSISNQVGTKDATDHAAILLPPGVA